MTTAISFSRQNDTGSLARAFSLLENLVLVLESGLLKTFANTLIKKRIITFLLSFYK